MKKQILMISSTIIVGLSVIFLTMIRNFPPIDINLPTYPELLLGWMLLIACFVTSIIYLMKFKIHRYKTIIILLVIINVCVIAIIFTVPLSKIWEDKMLLWHSKDYEKVISLVIKEEIKPVTTIQYPNQITESVIILPEKFKYISATRDVWVYRWAGIKQLSFALPEMDFLDVIVDIVTQTIINHRTEHIKAKTPKNI